jgi:type IV fimbrial biogenesis protein FimT
MNEFNMARRPDRPDMKSSVCGFTLQEMLVVLCISGSLAGGGVGMWSAVQQNAVTAAANELVSHLALARSEAVKRGVRVTMCPTRDQESCMQPDKRYALWHQGWLVYEDANDNGTPERGEIVRLQTGASRGIVIRSSHARSRITYQPLGMSGGSTVTFAVCSERNPALARYVIVSNTGRARVAQTTSGSVRCD